MIPQKNQLKNLFTFVVIFGFFLFSKNFFLFLSEGIPYKSSSFADSYYEKQIIRKSKSKEISLCKNFQN